MVQVSNKMDEERVGPSKKVYMDQEWVGQKYARD